MKTSQMSLRVQTPLWENDAVFERFFKLICDVRPVDELALFTHDIHTPAPLATMLRRAKILKQRIRRLKAAGFRTGVNNLCTLGHADENLAVSRQLCGRLFMDIDGRTSPGNFCPRDREWRQNYIVPLYRALAETEPDFIWIDDDLRLNGHGAAQRGCFCDVCFRDLLEHFGLATDRAGFIAYFDGGAPPEELRRRRKKLLEWNRQVLLDELRVIEETVHGVDAAIVLGKMDCVDSWEADRVREVQVLAGKNGAPVIWRPGGGFYTDFRPDEMLGKERIIEMVVADLSPQVSSIYSEIENFPYLNLRKSRKITALESSLYCVAGCTGAALNVLPDDEWSPMESYAELLRALKAQKSFNDRIVACKNSQPNTGIWDGADKDQELGNGERSANFLRQPVEWPPSSLNSCDFPVLGLPLTESRAGCRCAVLNAFAARGLEDVVLAELLSQGVYMDCGALDVLNERGFAEYTGFVSGEKFDRDAMELAVEHPLNPEHFLRNPRQSFWGGTATALEPAAEDACVLTKLVDYERNVLAPCTSGVFVNRFGGRIAVAGCSPWDFLAVRPKYLQMHAIFRWLSRGELDAEIPDCRARISIWSCCGNGRLTAFLLNTSLDPVENLVVRLRTGSTSALLIRNGRADETIFSSGGDENFADFTIDLPPFELLLLETEIG